MQAWSEKKAAAEKKKEAAAAAAEKKNGRTFKFCLTRCLLVYSSLVGGFQTSRFSVI